MSRERVIRMEICPHHNQGLERTASLAIYSDGGEHCHACGYNKQGDGNGKESYKEKEEKESDRQALRERLSVIAGLQKQNIRGLHLPADSTGYYIVWPSGDYYKFRLHSQDGMASHKYICPAGITPDLFADLQRKTNILWIVEGEINAMSLRLVNPYDDIVSPGGTGSFHSTKYLTSYAGYGKVVIVVDNDKSGAEAALKLKPMLLQHTHDVDVIMLKRDFNQVLCEDGKQGLTKTYLELRSRLRLDQAELRAPRAVADGTGRETTHQEQEGASETPLY